MKYLKILMLAIVAVFTFGSANAQVQLRADIGPRYYYHHHYWHHRYWRHHRWMYRD